MICPICNKLLIDNRNGDYKKHTSKSPLYYCNTWVQFLDCEPVAHYEIYNSFYIWYPAPFRIWRSSFNSHIDRFLMKSFVDSYPVFSNLLKIEEIIHFDDLDKVAKRINKLILFS